MAERWRSLGHEDKLQIIRALVDCREAVESPPPGLYAPDAYRRLFAHVFLHKKLGTRLYRQLADRRLPSRRWRLALHNLRFGSGDEILEWRGLTADRPFQQLYLSMFRELMGFGRLRIVTRQFLRVGEHEPTRARFLVRSRSNGGEMWLYADLIYRLVARRSDEPCPFCGEPLRTPRARQCGYCRMDWHDPGNVFSRSE